MEKQKMTIHRALAELKLIDSRIEKGIVSLDPIGAMQKDKLVNGVKTKEEFEKESKSQYQSVMDLIERKQNIKSAIVKANAETKVEISGNKMTIADAINYKRTIEFKKALIEAMTKKYKVVKSKFVLENEKINNVALDNAKIMIGKQGDDRVKATDDDVKAIVEPFVKRNEFHLVDPLNIENKIRELEKEVDDFELEVDAALSEINAITTIEI